jgi:hypothetical protein
MDPRRYEIWWARRQWRQSSHEHPWLIVHIVRREGRCVYYGFPISTKKYATQTFRINPRDPRAASVNADDVAYIHYESLFEIARCDFARVHPKGRIEGELLEEFLREAGLDE